MANRQNDHRLPNDRATGGQHGVGLGTGFASRTGRNDDVDGNDLPMPNVHERPRENETSTEDFRNENAFRFNRGKEGDLNWRRSDYDEEDYIHDYSDNVNYGERYGFAAYGRAHYDPEQNRGWQENTWYADEPFTNREQIYRGRSNVSEGNWGDPARRVISGNWEDRPRREDDLGLNRGIPDGMQQTPNSGRSQGWNGGSSEGARSNGRTGYAMDPYGSGAHTGKGPKNYQRLDSRIQEEVCERLMQDPEVDPSDVEVTVSQGVVTLAGSVPDRRTKRMIENVADRVSGVKDVQNQVRISSQAPQVGSMKSQSADGAGSQSNGRMNESVDRPASKNPQDNRVESAKRNRTNVS